MRRSASASVAGSRVRTIFDRFSEQTECGDGEDLVRMKRAVVGRDLHPGNCRQRLVEVAVRGCARSWVAQRAVLDPARTRVDTPLTAHESRGDKMATGRTKLAAVALCTSAVFGAGATIASATRTVKIGSRISISEKGLTFRGRVTSSNTACEAARKVALYRTNGLKLGTAKSGSAGGWKLTVPGSAGISLGHFYAKARSAARAPPGRSTCARLRRRRRFRSSSSRVARPRTIRSRCARRARAGALGRAG